MSDTYRPTTRGMQNRVSDDALPPISTWSGVQEAARQQYDQAISEAKRERDTAVAAAEAVYSWRMAQALRAHRVARGMPVDGPAATPMGPCSVRAEGCEGLGHVALEPYFQAAYGDTIYQYICPACLARRTQEAREILT